MYLAFNCLQDGNSNSGLVAKHIPPFSMLTNSRISYEEEIENTGNVDKAVTAIANNYFDDIRNYILFRGETPIQNPIGAFIQAVLLRTDEIAYIAKATDSDEIDALHIIEDAETEAMNLKLPNSEYILGANIQAAIKKTIEQLKRLRKDAGLAPSLISFVEDCGSDGRLNGLSWFDYLGNVTQGDPLYNKEYWNDIAVIQNAMYPETVVDNADGFLTTVFNELKNLVKQAGQVVQPELDAVATKSVKQALLKNLPLILLIAVAIGAIIYFASNAAKNK